MTNIDFLKKLPRKMNNKKPRHCSNKRILGKSIDECPRAIDLREYFDHRETDIIIGNKVKSDTPLLTLAERNTCFDIILKLGGKEISIETNQVID